MTTQDILPRTKLAHELYGDFWFNSAPVPITALRGRVVLIHFWDCTCINCARSLPYIIEWQKKYEKYGLVVVGVHTPKFPFGKNPEQVEKAIRKLGIEYPVVMDNEYLIANNYGNRTWPSIYLVDQDGYIRFQNFGEGHYAATEQFIQTLLYSSGMEDEFPLLMEPLRETDKPGAICYRVTPELFAGYLRGSIGNIEGYAPESVVHYDDPKIYLGGRFYVEGDWMNDRNSLRFTGDESQAGRIILNYQALEVIGVFGSEDEKGFEVTVEQDERFLTEENKGEDVRIDTNGRSFFVIDKRGMFGIVKNKEYGEHFLRLTTRNTGFSFYSFTFVSCVIPELISRN